MTERPLVLVTDGSSLSARQVIDALGRRGAVVEAVDSSSRPLAAFSRHVRRVHRVPSYGRDPWGWLDATLQVLAGDAFDVLLAVHEQTAVLARAAERVRATGVGLAVPSFAALERVQDKLAANEALERAGLTHPPTALASVPEEVADLARELPVYLKARIGTATSAVFRATDEPSLEAAVAQLRRRRAFRDGVLVQQPVEGPLVMIQAVFDGGVLVAHHANLRVREGASGGSSHKLSVAIEAVERDLVELGRTLDWHGALSLDAIRSEHGMSYIDVNPRLVEPGNAQRSGVDLVGRVVDLALGATPTPSPPGRPGIATHQLMLAILGAAQRGGGRRGVAWELTKAALHVGSYRGSKEELTPVLRDPQAAVPLGATAATLLLRPGAHRKFTGGAIANYALTAAAWRQICERDGAGPAEVDEGVGMAVRGGRPL